MKKLFENSSADRLYISAISQMLELSETGICILENIKSEFVPFLKILDLPDF